MKEDDDFDSSLDKVLLRIEYKFKKYKQYLKDYGYYIKTNVEYTVDEIKRSSEPTPTKDRESDYTTMSSIPNYFGN